MSKLFDLPEELLKSFRVVTVNAKQQLEAQEHPMSRLIFEANKLGLDGKQVLSVSKRNPDPVRSDLEFIMYVEDLVQI